MLGVRRRGVNAAAGKRRDDKIIRYQRGWIEVLDRAGLEARYCECYAAVEAEYARFLVRMG